MTQEPSQSWPPPDDVHPWSVPAVDPLSGEPVPGGVPPEPASWAPPPPAAYPAGYPAPWPGSTSGPQAWPQPGYPYPPAYPAPYYPAPPYSTPYAQPYPGSYAPAGPTNGLAIAALVLGVIWVFWIGSVLAVVFGHLARNQIRRTGERGDQMAVAGLVLGWIGVGFLGLTLLGVILDGT